MKRDSAKWGKNWKESNRRNVSAPGDGRESGTATEAEGRRPGQRQGRRRKKDRRFVSGSSKSSR